MWTVEWELEQPVTHLDLSRSGGSFVANLTLRLAPDPDEPGVSFTSAVAGAEAAFFIPFAEEGVRAFVARRMAEGRGVGHLRVTLTAITIHPRDAKSHLDAKSHRFRQAAEMAMTHAFDAAGVRL